MTLDSQKHIHFIGICGVAMLPWRSLKKMAGSLPALTLDFPPISTELENHNINFIGWRGEDAKNGVPDLVVVGNVASSNGPVDIRTRAKHSLLFLSDLCKYIVRKIRLFAGTYGD